MKSWPPELCLKPFGALGITYQPKEKTMKSSIFEIQDNLHHFGARYVLWTEGLSIRTLYAIWIAQGMTQHQSNKWSKA